MAGMTNFPGPASALQMCIVASGGDPDKGDHPKDQSCNLRLFSPTEHSQDIGQNKELPFSTLLRTPGQHSQQSFPGAPDPGTIVYMLKAAGEAGGIMMGQSNTLLGSGGGAGNLMSGFVSEMQKMDIGVSMPPKIQETEENGVKIRKIQESGKMHSLSQLEGLPVHGALFNMSGFRLPEIKQVPTAKQHAQEMMSNQMMQQLTGQIMSLGQMFQGLLGKVGQGGGGGGMPSLSAGGGAIIPQAAPTPFQTLPGAGAGPTTPTTSTTTAFDRIQISQANRPNIQAAIRSLSNLVQGLEVNNGVAFFTGDVVHEETYLQHAETLLSQADTIDDVMGVLSRLQWDTSLFGREKLDNVVVQLETAFGVVLQEVDYNGNIMVQYDSEAQAALKAFDQLVSSNTGAPNIASAPAPTSNFGGGGGGGGGGSGGGAGQIGQIAQQVQSMIGQMFGKSAEQMKDMYKRMAPMSEQEAKKMHEKLGQGQDQASQKMQQIVKSNNEGGNPLETNNYDDGGAGGGGGSGNFGVSFM